MLTAAQLQQFQEDGFLVIHHFFDPAHVEQMLSAWQEVKRELQMKTERYQRADRFVVGQLPQVLDKLYKTDHLVQTASHLLGEENVAVYLSNFLLKDENWDGRVETHQDMPYASGSQQKVITFVPLQPQNEENGGLKILKGTHKYGNFGIRGTIHPEQFPNIATVCPSLEVGDVMFLNVLTWHYSEPTQGGKERPMLQIMYQPAWDGAYVGLEQPTLVAGEWQTAHFLSYGLGITPDSTSLQQNHDQKVAQLEAQLQHAQAELQATRADLTKLQNRVSSMESSKFWQLRSQWFQLKRIMGLGSGSAL